MRKVSDILHEIVMRQSFLEEALYHGYLNLTGFAEYIRPYVEKELQKEISVHAIKMGLSRMKRPGWLASHMTQFHPSRITTRGNLAVMSIVRSASTMKKIHAIFSRKSEESGYCAIIEGSSEVDIIFDPSFYNAIHDLISEDYRILEIKNLSLCSLLLDDKEVYKKGLFYDITKQLAFHSINIIQVISTYHELGIIVKSEDLKRVVSILVE